MKGEQPSLAKGAPGAAPPELLQPLRAFFPHDAELLAKLGLHTVADLLFYFPKRYEDFTQLRRVEQLQEGQDAVVCGVIRETDHRRTRRGKHVSTVVVEVDGGLVRCVWFHQPFRRTQLARGGRVAIQGKPRRKGVTWEFVHPRVVMLDETTSPTQKYLLPVYGLTAGLEAATLRSRIRWAVEQYAREVPEMLPESFRQEKKLLGVQEAVRRMHLPASQQEAREARRRFAYQELWMLQLAMGLKRAQRQEQARAPVLPVDSRIDARIRRRFAFELTEDQRKAVEEIAADMARPVPMARLLQGDVGSGKTVVAQYAMLLAVAHGYKAALMAPTEVLARQHARTLFRSLRGSRVRTGLLVGSLTPAQRQRVRDELAQGEIDLLIGTQALVHEKICWDRLGLVVIDEQHRFGVMQRAHLRHGEQEPHYLVMTATPIPRTVALALYGDLDVSVLRERPPGRQPVKTYWVRPDQEGKWWAFVRRKLHEGRQAMVVASRVEGDPEREVAGVEELAKRLGRGVLSGFRLGMLHGRLPPAEKDRIMIDFASGKIDVLVATSVIEVGIDVPNAVVMTIEGAEHFGLAQLHQMRGRVGRGAFPGFVGLFAQPSTEEAIRRLEAFVATNDGFEIAEADFRLRGAGELLGTRQHGATPLRVADLRKDAELLQEAREDALAILKEDPHLASPKWQAVRERIVRRYGELLELAEVG